ncbi:hypothetical protein O181_040659 [Austropuccinia psidii MF-1]|uniref:Uncharacterized protein n=1 Tax=Austropuccinia psidii MF-1 TaxID=1389203 RepID=A0A9Q3DCQ0_9BASI|nr:hypothetical protein [Austropuccinia psidii MF-1]
MGRWSSNQQTKPRHNSYFEEAMSLMVHSCKPCPTPRDHFSASIASKRAIKLTNARMTQTASNAEETTRPKTARTQHMCHLLRDVYNALTKIYTSMAPPTNSDTPASANAAPFERKKPNKL